MLEVYENFLEIKQNETSLLEYVLKDEEIESDIDQFNIFDAL
jgi:hypothetical protein